MWLSHLTGKKSGHLNEPNKIMNDRTTTEQGGAKKKKTTDGMDVSSDIDEGSFFWIGDEASTTTTTTTTSSSFSSSSLPHSTSSLYPSFFQTSSGGPVYPPLSSKGAPSSPPPPYPGRPATSPSTTSSSLNGYPALEATLAAPARRKPGDGLAGTAAYAPLVHSSLSLNPRLAPLQAPPPVLPAAMWKKFKEMEARLKQGVNYDPCFEGEIVAQVKHDRHIQDERRRTLEAQHREYVQAREAEAKRLQDIAITEWVEQQQRKQQSLSRKHGEEGATSTYSTSTDVHSPNVMMDIFGVEGGKGLIDLDNFPSPTPTQRLPVPSSGQVLAVQNSESEPPPPYPGGPYTAAATQPLGGRVNFPAPPTPSTGHQRQSNQYSFGAHAPPLATSAAAGPVVAFPAPTSHSTIAGGLNHQAVMPLIPHQLHQPLISNNPVPPQNSVHISPTTASPPGSGRPPLPASLMLATPPVNLPAPSFGFGATNGPRGQSNPSSLIASTSTPPHRTTMEEYQRKYPVLANAEKRTIFIKMLEMRFNPEIVAMGLEVYPDSKLEKIIAFVSNFHKLAEMGYPMERIKQALLLYDDIQKAIVYIEELDKLVQGGLKEAQIFDAFLMFDNDIEKASAFLQAYKSLAQFGFDDVHIREALLMCDNSPDRAAQYLMMNNNSS